MFERKDLETLAAFSGTQPVTSLYLNMPPRLRTTPEAYRTRLKNLLRSAAGRAPDKDIAALENFFEKEFDWMGRGVAVFSGQGDGLWEVVPLAVPLRHSSIHVADKPFILPLVNLIDSYGAITVALVDQQEIRMFHFHLGDLTASDTLEGEEIKRIKSGGGAAGRARGDELDGHRHETVKGNLKDFADALTAFCARHKPDHILLGGSEPTCQKFKTVMPQPCASQVAGMFPISFHAPESEILAQSLAVIQANEEAAEKRLVEAIQTAAAKGSNGVVGLKETLKALKSGRVQTLAVIEDHHDPEAIDNAVTKAVDFGGNVTFVNVDSPLVKSEGIGALLRY
ncbi:MAG: hypothetical protein JXJ17_03180 [Anaerolineae bacterium]|nr:hypothetical protein [Anaerolineae bacterium]